MRSVAISAVLLLALTACSGGDDEPTATNETSAAPVVEQSPEAAEDPTLEVEPTPEVEEEAPGGDEEGGLREAVQAYSDAFLTGDGEAAFALFSQRCQDRTDKAMFNGAVEQAGGLYGDPLPFETFEADMSGDMARVTYTYAVSAINQDSEPWAREGGDWKQDDC